MRIGKSPMTNLHLGSDRDNYDTFISIVGESNWLKMKDTCEAAAAVFPKSLYCGIDLLVYPDLQRHTIIEINAFGDLIPGTLHQGMDTYTSEVKAILRNETY
jgi:D-alanine-D-alanine ligase-like ATP-grasp enzyme